MDILKENNIATIVVAGIDGNCCVAASALDAAAFGFSVIFPLEYIGILSRKQFQKTREKLCNAAIKIIDAKL